MDYDFIKDFENLGIKKGDIILMHSSMKALKTTLSPQEFLSLLIDYLGEKGTLLLPALSYDLCSQDNPVFGVEETPACIGLLPNVFLNMKGVIRSVHPSHSCAGIGYHANEILSKHYLDRTPMGENSPFRKIAEFGGKILMVGSVNEHNTLMHAVEEIGGAPYCLKKDTKDFTVIGYDKKEQVQKHYCHDFTTVKELYYPSIENLLPSYAISRGKIGGADCTLMSASEILKVGVQKVRENPWYFADKKD
jgi:aminoglycoside 3-N-acetyltransferase